MCPCPRRRTPRLPRPGAKPRNPQRPPPGGAARLSLPRSISKTGGRQYNVTDIVERVKADYRLTHKVGVQSCKIYIKPEDGAAYYVVNKVEGKLDL